MRVSSSAKGRHSNRVRPHHDSQSESIRTVWGQGSISGSSPFQTEQSSDFAPSDFGRYLAWRREPAWWTHFGVNALVPCGRGPGRYLRTARDCLPPHRRLRALASPSCFNNCLSSRNLEVAGTRPVNMKAGAVLAILCHMGQRTRKKKFRKITKKEAKQRELQRPEGNPPPVTSHFLVTVLPAV